MNETWTDEVIGRTLYGVGLFGIGYYGQTDWDEITPSAATWTNQVPTAATWAEETS